MGSCHNAVLIVILDKDVVSVMTKCSYLMTSCLRGGESLQSWCHDYTLFGSRARFSGASRALIDLANSTGVMLWHYENSSAFSADVDISLLYLAL